MSRIRGASTTFLRRTRDRTPTRADPTRLVAGAASRIARKHRLGSKTASRSCRTRTRTTTGAFDGTGGKVGLIVLACKRRGDVNGLLGAEREALNQLEWPGQHPEQKCREPNDAKIGPRAHVAREQIAT